MLRTLLIATALLTTSGAALARGDHDYGRVISVEPHFSISFGTRHHDGFRVLYESGGHHYWTHSSYHPGHYYVRPPHHRIKHGYHYRDYGWDRHDRHYGKGHRDDWHDDRRDDRHDRRDHREHRRH
jgi:hypothetical protein